MSRPLPPGSTVGVLGGGQLGRMLAIAAHRMGYRVASWIGGPDEGPAEAIDLAFATPFEDEATFEAFVAAVDVVTVEFENVPAPLLERLAERVPVFPKAKCVAIAQHREREKRFLSAAGFPCAAFRVVDSAASLAEAMVVLPGFAERGGILKTAEFGYDGKGQRPVAPGEDAGAVWAAFGSERAVLEERIPLAAEISVLVVRSQDGRVAAYDPVENVHTRHILDLSRVPARVDPARQEEARRCALGIVAELDYVGLLAVEFFIAEDGRVLVNELAPRPHNSGHHTIDACETSQFEQQLRAVCGYGPGSVRLRGPAVMMNLLGDVWEDAGGEPDWASVLELPGASLHLYGKRSARRGRKMGHLTFTGPDESAVERSCREARKILQMGETMGGGTSLDEFFGPLVDFQTA